MTDIHKIAVLGSGVMGSGIAALAANAGIPVVMLDIVPQGEAGRNALCENAIQKQLKAQPSGFIHPSRAKLITCGNLEDHLDLLKDCDWIIEAVLEKLEVKQEVYRKVDSVRKPGSVVSSNTSTLPLHVLTGGMPEAFRRDFMITHFFNPPRFMRLLELVPGETSAETYETMRAFADEKLGKGVVKCKDTPGFIANRIGVFWMMAGLIEAMRLGLTVEQADAVMGRPAGIPKTGVFGLFDLIGIDLMPLIAKAMLATLPQDDPFRALYQEPELVKKMIAEGYTGRKGKGGFTRITKDGGKKIKEIIDLKTGQYRPEGKADLASVEAAQNKSKEGGLRALLTHPDIGGQYAWAVLSKTLHYAASLIPEISDDILSVDDAMRMGYSWKYGPFELIDRMGTKEETGAAWFAAQLQKEGKTIPPILEKTAGKPLYAVTGGKRGFMTLKGEYAPIPTPPGVLLLSDLKLSQKPVAKNASASLWDLGDGVACLEFTSKMNAVDPDILAMMQQSLELVKKDFKGLVIGNDADNFCVGANLAFMLMAANVAAWEQISGIIRQGQKTMMAMKYAPFPVVSALAGMALGGGCEIVLHSGAVQAHAESYPGLVEVGVGLIPGWGGCKEMLLRHLSAEGQARPEGRASLEPGLMAFSAENAGGNQKGIMPSISKVFETIMFGKVASSAEEARDMKVLPEAPALTMNRARLLADAKALVLKLAPHHQPSPQRGIHLPGPSGRVALQMAVDQFVASGKATAHDAVIAKGLARVLTGGDTDISEPLTEQHILDLEHEVFMELVKQPATLARIEHMLNTGKPLRN